MRPAGTGVVFNPYDFTVAKTEGITGASHGSIPGDVVSGVELK